MDETPIVDYGSDAGILHGGALGLLSAASTRTAFSASRVLVLLQHNCDRLSVSPIHISLYVYIYRERERDLVTLLVCYCNAGGKRTGIVPQCYVSSSFTLTIRIN
jgi:hypothetical protein